MDISNPQRAQGIVADYLRVAEAHAARDVYPSSLRELPHSKETIRAAFRSSVGTLTATGQLTEELRDYLEIAYVSLADYVDDECVTLLREYARAGEELAADPRLPRDKATSEAWKRLAEQSRLAGQLAKAISDEAARLRGEFRSWENSQ